MIISSASKTQTCPPERTSPIFGKSGKRVRLNNGDKPFPVTIKACHPARQQISETPCLSALHKGQEFPALIK